MNRFRIFFGACALLFAVSVGTLVFPVQSNASDKEQSGSMPVLVPPQPSGYEAALDLRQAGEYARARGYPEAVIARLSSVMRVFVYEYHTGKEEFLLRWMGSGVFVGDGTVLSAAHISSGDSDALIPLLKKGFECMQIRVAVQFGDAPKLLAHIVFFNTAADLFTVRFAADSFPKSIVPIPIAEQDPAVGEELYIDGFLFGGEDQLIMSDIPTVPPPVFFRIAGEEAHGRGRFLFVQHPEYGYSGGALLNAKGELQGITVAASRGGVFGSAVSRREILKALSQITTAKPYCPE